MQEKFITITEASKLLTLAKSTIYQYVYHRSIPFIKIGGRIVFEEEKLRQWMQANKKEVIDRK